MLCFCKNDQNIKVLTTLFEEFFFHYLKKAHATIYREIIIDSETIKSIVKRLTNVECQNLHWNSKITYFFRSLILLGLSQKPKWWQKLNVELAKVEAVTLIFVFEIVLFFPLHNLTQKPDLFFLFGYVAIFMFDVFPKFALVVCFPNVVDPTINY